MHCRLISTYQEVSVEIHINRFNTATFFCCLKPGPEFPTSNMSLSFFCSISWVRDDCPFCWYWWNCWPSLIKPSFQNVHHEITCTIEKVGCPNLMTIRSTWKDYIYLMTIWSTWKDYIYTSWLSDLHGRTIYIPHDYLIYMKGLFVPHDYLI